MTQINSLSTLNHRFHNFGKKMNDTKRVNSEYFISQVKKYQKQYQQNNNLNVFCKEAINLADIFSNSGKIDYANILFSWIIKNKFLPTDIREKVIQKAYENASKQNDTIQGRFLPRFFVVLMSD